MRKVFFFFLFFFLFSSSVFAQSAGYNIVNNLFDEEGGFNEEVFAVIGENNPGGAVTVRLTSGDLESHPNLIQEVQDTAAKYNLDVVWQPEDWQATTPQRFEEFWLPKLKQINRGTISLFVEYNYHYGHPDYYAEILKAALDAGLSNLALTNLNITNPSGGRSPFGEEMFDYRKFLRQVSQRCPSCLESIPVWSISSYGKTAEETVGQIKNFVASLREMGISLQGKRLIIPEIGLDPQLPIEERIAKIGAFAQKIERIVKYDPEFRQFLASNGLELSSFTFLLMDDKTGKQYLLVKDKNGNWVVKEYAQLGIFAGGGPGRGEVCDYAITVKRLKIRGKSEADASRQARRIALTEMKIATWKNTAESVFSFWKNIRPPEDEEEKKKKRTPQRISPCLGYIEFYYCDDNGELKRLGEGEDKITFQPASYAPQGAASIYQAGDWLTAGESRKKDSPLEGEAKVGRGFVAAKPAGVLGTKMPSLSCGDKGDWGEVMPTEKTVAFGEVIFNLPLAVLRWVRDLISGELRKEVIYKEYLVYEVIYSPHSEIAGTKMTQEVSSPFTLPGDEHEETHGLGKQEIKGDNLEGEDKEFFPDAKKKGEEETNQYILEMTNPPDWPL
ncbi:hypothetical protein J7J95_01085 [bacterium]|nr:hypothetical protein [bacterium]